MKPQNLQQSGRSRIDRLLLVLLLPGLLSAIMLGVWRHSLESRSKAVELTLDYAELQSLSAASGVRVPELLARLKEAGITGVAVSEDLLGDLAATGQVSYAQRESEAGTLTIIRTSSRQLANRVEDSLEARLNPDMLIRLLDLPKVDESGIGNSQQGATAALVVRASPATLNTMGIGLPPDAVQIVKASGLSVVARLQNHPALTTRAVDAAVMELVRNDINILICAGEEVIGFRGLIPYAAGRMKAADIIYGSVEFARQRGDTRMSKELGSWHIRVHSISGPEMAGITPLQATERFVRAVKERNIRLCYIRLPETSGQSPVKNNLAFVSQIRDGIERAGYHAGVARPLEASHRPRLMLALIALSISAGAVLLLGSLVSLTLRARYGLLAVFFAGGLSVTFIGETGLQLLAFGAALIFPTLGVTMLLGPHLKRTTSERSPLLKSVGFFLGVSLFSLIGAVLIVGLLADRSYMVKLNQFMGVKAAHLLPMAGVIFVMASGLPIFGKSFAATRREVTENLGRVVAHPLFVWHALAVVAAFVIVGFALLRTGNDPGLGVSGLELKFRSILDQIMSVRPRTKEFLIGHPALFLGIRLLLTRRMAWGLPLIALGVIGQVSMLNTFCHIHTPLQVTLLRVFNGLVLGLVLGIGAWYICGRPKESVQPATKE